MTLSSWVDNAFQALAIDEHRKPFRPSIWDQSAKANGQVLEQVWFAGVHSNVGGSYPDTGLSDITLLWMTSKLKACGLAIDLNRLPAGDKPRPDGSGKLYNSQTVWYKITGLGDYVRPMGQKVKESASSTGVNRMKEPATNYKPPNLERYLESGGSVTQVP